MDTLPSLQRQLEQQRTLAEAALNFNASLNLGALLSRVVNTAVELMGTDEALILLPDDEHEYLHVGAYTGDDSSAPTTFRLRIQRSVAGQVFAGSESTIVTDQPIPELGIDYPLKSLVLVPMRVRGQNVGVLGVIDRTEGLGFSDYDIELLRQLASHAGVAIENARLYQHSQARSFELALIIDSTEAVNSTLSLAEVLSLIGKSLIKALQAHWCEVLVCDTDNNSLYTWSVQREAIWQAENSHAVQLEQLPSLAPVLNGANWVTLQPGTPQEKELMGEARQSLFMPVNANHASGIVPGVLQLAYLQEALPQLKKDTIQELATALASNLSTNETTRALHFARQIVRDAEASWCSFWNMNPANHLQLRISSGSAIWLKQPYPTRTLKDFPTFLSAIKTRTITSFATIDSNLPPDIRQVMNRMQARVLMVVPLFVQDNNLGLVLIGHNLRTNKFDSREINLTHALVLQAANAIKNAQLYEDLQHSLEQLRHTQAKLVQTARLSAIGQLAAAVAHQINNPLTTVLGDTELILRDIHKDDINRESLEAIKRAGQRAHEVVKRLLGMARQKAAHEDPELLDVNVTIHNTLTLVESTLYRGRVQLRMELSDNMPYAKGIPGQLEDVWLNLIMNARDAIANEKKPMINIRSEYNAEANEVRVIIWDNGPGLGSDIKDNAFDAFFTTKPAGEGTGLGLYICKLIVERCGGCIEIDSTYDKGARFIVSLPCS